MPTVWGHIEAVVNPRKAPPSLVVRTTTPLGTHRTECTVEADTIIRKGFEQLGLDDLHAGEFVVVTVDETSPWLRTKRVDVVIFQQGKSA